MNRLCTEVRAGWREINKVWDRNLKLARMGAVTTPDLQGRNMEDAVVGRRLHGGICGLTEGCNSPLHGREGGKERVGVEDGSHDPILPASNTSH